MDVRGLRRIVPVASEPRRSWPLPTPLDIDMDASHLRVGITTVALVAFLSVVALGASFERPALGADLPARSGGGQEAGEDSAAVKLMVLYPQPTDVAQFEADYRAHLQLLHREMGIPDDERPYTVTRFRPTPSGPAPYFQLFTLTFESAEALREARARPGMQAVAADAARISSGGAPVVLVGSEV